MILKNFTNLNLASLVLFQHFKQSNMQQSPSVPPLRLSTVLNDDGVPSSNTSLAVQLAHILDSTSPTPLDRRAAEAIRKFQLINTSAEPPVSPVAAGAVNNISSSSSENAEDESLDFPDGANQAEPAMHASSSSQSLTALSASLRSPLGSPADSPSPMARYLICCFLCL
jgi:hypothetical protein